MRLLRNAVKKHTRLAQEASVGEGVDRHMLGSLFNPLSECQLITSCMPGLRLSKPATTSAPELFSDPLFTRSSRWNLSTSAIFSKHFGAYGWGEVVPDGFGVAYMTGFDGASTPLVFNDAINKDAHLRMSLAPQITYNSRSPLVSRCPTPSLQRRSRRRPRSSMNYSQTPPLIHPVTTARNWVIRSFDCVVVWNLRLKRPLRRNDASKLDILLFGST